MRVAGAPAGEGGGERVFASASAGERTAYSKIEGLGNGGRLWHRVVRRARRTRPAVTAPRAFSLDTILQNLASRPVLDPRSPPSPPPVPWRPPVPALCRVGAADRGSAAAAPSIYRGHGTALVRLKLAPCFANRPRRWETCFPPTTASLIFLVRAPLGALARCPVSRLSLPARLCALKPDPVPFTNTCSHLRL